MVLRIRYYLIHVYCVIALDVARVAGWLYWLVNASNKVIMPTLHVTGTSVFPTGDSFAPTLTLNANTNTPSHGKARLTSKADSGEFGVHLHSVVR